MAFFLRLQMLSLFANEDAYPVSTPPAYSQYIADASSWANVDFYSFFNIGCLVSVPFLDAAMIQMVVPAALIFLAMVAFVAFSKKGDTKKANACVQFIVVFTFLLFVSTSNKVRATCPNCFLFNCSWSPRPTRLVTPAHPTDIA